MTSIDCLFLLQGPARDLVKGESGVSVASPLWDTSVQGSGGPQLVDRALRETSKVFDALGHQSHQVKHSTPRSRLIHLHTLFAVVCFSLFLLQGPARDLVKGESGVSVASPLWDTSVSRALGARSGLTPP